MRYYDLLKVEMTFLQSIKQHAFIYSEIPTNQKSTAADIFDQDQLGITADSNATKYFLVYK